MENLPDIETLEAILMARMQRDGGTLHPDSAAEAMRAAGLWRKEESVVNRCDADDSAFESVPLPETDTQVADTDTTPFACLDHQRKQRCGHPEAVFAEHKSTEQCVAIAREMLNQSGMALLTRCTPAQTTALGQALPEAMTEASTCGRTLLLGEPPELRPIAPVTIACAGTSDLPVAEEAALTLRSLGIPCTAHHDIGVAGLHRLMDRADALHEAGAIIAVAGMEGAMPSVIAGLVACPVIAVPTSVGYGAGQGGLAALLAMLTSCAAGITVVNIDNGYGAACAAGRILRDR